MNKRSKTILGLSALIVLCLAAWLALRRGSEASAAMRYVTRPVGYADISASVSETGTVNPVNEVEIGSEVSGTIINLSADYNSVVRKGQVLAKLDPTTYQAVVDSAKATLSLDQASLDSSKVSVGKMKALMDLAKLTVERDEPLAKQGLINENQMDTERTSAETAEQDYESAQAAVKVAEAQVSVAKGQLAQAQYNLTKTVITSPFDGIIMARNVSLGQTVASSLQTPTLFTLATDLSELEVDTSVDEADVGFVRAGEGAEFTVTAFPNQPFHGKVNQVRVNPTTVSNVVTYDAVVLERDTSGRLFPGMTAQVDIEIGKRSHVLAVPIAAVLYRPLAVQGAGQAPAGGMGGGFGGGFGGGSAVQSSSGQAVAGAPGSQVTLWLLRAGRPAPVQVVIGLSDGKNIEITKGALAEGDQVIVAQYRGSQRAHGSGQQPAGGGQRAPANGGAADSSGGR